MVQHKWYPVTMEIKRGAATKRAKTIRESGASAKIQKITRYTDNTLSRKRVAYIVHARDRR